MKTRYYNLKFGDKFTHTGKILQKESAFWAVTSFGSRVEAWVWPWTRVRIVSPESEPSLFLLARAAALFEAETAKAFSAPSPFLDMLEPGKFPVDLGRTHFYGDDCYPPHEISREIYDAFKNLEDDNRTGPSA